MAAFNSKVEVEFTTGVWTDVSQWVEGFETNRGRSYEFDEIETGTGSLQLNNADGRFTPGRTTSPYYPNVKPRRRVRVSTDVSSVVTPVFNGWVEKWPVVVNQGTSSVTATLADDLAGLARTKITGPILHQRIRAYSPSDYWPLDDPDTATSARAVVGEPLSLVTGNVGEEFSPGGPGLFAAGEQGFGGSWVRASEAHYVPGPGASEIVRIPKTLTLPANPSRTNFTLSTPWAFAATFDISAMVAELDGGAELEWRMDPVRCGPGGASSDEAFRFSFNSTTIPGPVRMYFESRYLSAAQVVFLPAGTSIVDLVLVYDPVNAPGVLRIEVGGQVVTPAVKVSMTAISGWSLSLGSTWVQGTGSYSVSNAAFWSPGFGQPDSLADGSFGTWMRGMISGETDFRVDDLIGDLLNIAGVSGDIGADDTRVVFPEPDAGESVLSVCRKVADSVDGLLYATHVGGTPRIKYLPRSARFAPGAAAITFRDSTGSSPEPGLTFDSDEARILNAVTVTRPGMATMSASDSASDAEFGPITDDVESWVVDDAVAQGMADWRIYLRKQPQIRCDQAEFNLTASAISPTLFAGLDIGSRVDIAELPDASPFTSAKFFVEGISFKCTKSGEVEEWSATLQLSPAEPWGVWVVEDATYGFIDSANAVLSY